MGYSNDDANDDLKHSFLRVLQLAIEPIEGKFDLDHLQKIHAYIFQDYPETAGKFRDATPRDLDRVWKKNRYYKGFGTISILYSHRDEDDRRKAEKLLSSIDLQKLRTKTKKEISATLAEVYAGLDYFHPFEDGNSRTIREFVRCLALELGYKLEWSKASRTELYLARDLAANERAAKEYTSTGFLRLLGNEIYATTVHPRFGKTLDELINNILVPDPNSKYNLPPRVIKSIVHPEDPTLRIQTIEHQGKIQERVLRVMVKGRRKSSKKKS